MTFEKSEVEFRDEVLIPRGWLAVRGAGSLGLADVVAIAPPCHKPLCEGIPVEAKAIKENQYGKYKYNVSHSNREIQQYKFMKKLYDEGYYPVFALKWKNQKAENLCELCDEEVTANQPHVSSAHDMTYEEYKEKYGTTMPEKDRWEIFDMRNVEEKHITRSDQKWPSFKKGEGLKVEEIFPDYSEKMDVEEIVDIKDDWEG